MSAQSILAFLAPDSFGSIAQLVRLPLRQPRGLLIMQALQESMMLRRPVMAEGVQLPYTATLKQ